MVSKTVFRPLFISAISIAIFCTYACSSSAIKDQQQILNDYSSAICQLQKLQREKDSILTSEIKPFELQLHQLKNESDNLLSVYDKKINELNKKKYEAGMNADEESERISKQHEAQHGHNITPEYERKVNAIEDKKSRQIKLYDQQIEDMTKKKETDGALQGTTSQIIQLKKKINEAKKNIQSQFDSKINDRKKQSAQANEKLDKIISALADSEKKKLLERKEKIKINPCQ